MWAVGRGPSSGEAGAQVSPHPLVLPEPGTGSRLPELAESVRVGAGQVTFAGEKASPSICEAQETRELVASLGITRQTVPPDPSPSRPQSKGSTCFFKG